MRIRALSGLVLMGLMLGSTATCTAADANTMTPAQKQQIESIVHDYLIKNPEVLVQALQALQQKQMDEAKKSIDKTHELAPKFADDLFRNSGNPILGNPKGAITLVEFFDYQCPHCIHMQPIVDALIKANPDLRVVYVEFPIRGAASELASKVALSAQNQNKYAAFYTAMINAKQMPLTEEAIYKVAKTVGLDETKIKADIKSKPVTDQIAKNMKLGQNLQLLGTPALFVAKTDVKSDAKPETIAFIPGQADQQQLQQIINKVKNNQLAATTK